LDFNKKTQKYQLIRKNNFNLNFVPLQLPKSIFFYGNEPAYVGFRRKKDYFGI